ncbi:uncharacterized protein PV09_09161 [Verruconis gallopava]|uniref:Uncharacterized protein n=1 Tax=Verruconis gallopava TaxID=253628 RepID=A0A0D1ZYI2_9PEZI|nr:uncharacterized protein PV09_09161 [Verruconis gallopava]KIV99129.1 hypothetical protein PV09_09161 [Verruconis gallopava]
MYFSNQCSQLQEKEDRSSLLGVEVVLAVFPVAQQLYDFDVAVPSQRGVGTVLEEQLGGSDAPVLTGELPSAGRAYARSLTLFNCGCVGQHLAGSGKVGVAHGVLEWCLQMDAYRVRVHAGLSHDGDRAGLPMLDGPVQRCAEAEVAYLQVCVRIQQLDNRRNVICIGVRVFEQDLQRRQAVFALRCVVHAGHAVLKESGELVLEGGVLEEKFDDGDALGAHSERQGVIGLVSRFLRSPGADSCAPA